MLDEVEEKSVESSLNNSFRNEEIPKEYEELVQKLEGDV